MATKKTSKKKKATLKKAPAKQKAKPSSTKKKAPKKAAKQATKKRATKKAPSSKKAAKKATKKAPAKKKAAKKKAAKKKAAPQPAKKKAAPKPAAKAKASSAANAAPTTTTTTIVQHVFIAASPEQVFDALTDATQHGKLTGGTATGDATVGATFTAWNGYITGKHLELSRGKLIVQEWSTTEFPKGHAPSRLEIALESGGGGTELTMTHTGVPTEQAEDYRQAWIDHYWNPLRSFFL